MKVRHTFLICRAAAFATLLVTAGAASLSIAAGAEDARQPQLAAQSRSADFVHSPTNRDQVAFSDSL